VIFLDANVPMYLVGGPHAHKDDARRVLERLVADQERLVTDAEVLQEILHRYSAIGRRDAIGPAFDALLGVVDEVFPVDVNVVTRARGLLAEHPALSARDAIHVATMRQHRVERIVSFDAGYDQVTGIVRLSA
jgi:uncharacterized protein